MNNLKEILRNISQNYNIDINELMYKYIYKNIKNIKNYDDVLFTDGSCINNGKRNAKGGMGVFFPNNISKNISLFLGKTTNQESELVAIYEGMKLSKNNDVLICTDSQYSINCITKWIFNWRRNGWKNSKNVRIKNYEVIKKIDDYMKKNKNKKFTFFHINSHQNEPNNKNSLEWYFWYGNMMADKLASNSIKN